MIDSGNLCCVSPKCQTTRARGPSWRGGHSSHPQPVTQGKLVTEGLESSCGEEDSFSHDTSTSCFVELQLCLQFLSPHNPHKEATFLHLPRSCGRIGRWGQGEAEVLRYSKAFRMSPVGCPPALSQGSMVTGIGREPTWARTENIFRLNFSPNEN